MKDKNFYTTYPYKKTSKIVRFFMIARRNPKKMKEETPQKNVAIIYQFKIRADDSETIIQNY